MNLNIWEWQLFYGMYGNRREERRLRHLARCAEKKEAKRLRAGRVKNARPFVRIMSTGFLIRIGNDLEVYEHEAVQRAEERIRQREDEWDDFLYEESFNYAPTDYDDESWDDDGWSDDPLADKLDWQ